MALVPLGVATVMLTVPSVCAGTTAVICVAEFTVKLVAAVVPKRTCVAPIKLTPVIVTVDPPAEDPLRVSRPQTAGFVLAAVGVLSEKIVSAGTMNVKLLPLTATSA